MSALWRLARSLENEITSSKSLLYALVTPCASRSPLMNAAPRLHEWKDLESSLQTSWKLGDQMP